ncbi:MAG: undecaprenyl/decaprenyl-phosphate alpha-N-acetylglucosaminyl 1-phosphate transferase [Phycisphaerae bacterium]|nr:undecaprenyl/decaprenyl-phosphate alpha-N-acetylglucosaminyl 1-phosphate transferase [Phycisphaerae bacterium]
MIWAALGIIFVSFWISFWATPVAKRLSHRLGFLDTPDKHKTHGRPIPMLGGSAIFAGILLPSILGLAICCIWNAKGIPGWLPEKFAIHIPGVVLRAPQALGILAAAGVLHVLGLIDDRKNLGPWVKLIVQILVAVGVVVFCNVRIMTFIGTPGSIIISVAWIVAITNAFNFLDNMDGLAAGVAVICAAALLGAAASVGQFFVAGWVCLILGATLGFLPHNFPPARIFMGDAGSLVIGFLLAVVSSLTTYVRPGQTHILYGALVPLLVMAVPLYDTISVMLIRIRQKRHPMVGDRNHFSHRLTQRGMTTRGTVLTIYLCTASTAIAATLLPNVNGPAAAILLFVQTIFTLGIIAILEATDK